MSDLFKSIGKNVLQGVVVVLAGSITNDLYKEAKKRLGIEEKEEEKKTF